METNVDTIIAGVSLCVSILAILINFLSQRKIRELDTKLKAFDLEERQHKMALNKQALVEANVIPGMGSKSSKLIVYNKGKSEARNVQIFVSPNDLDIHVEKKYFPYPKLQSQQSFELPFFYFGEEPHHIIRMIWEDDYDTNRSNEMVLDM